MKRLLAALALSLAAGLAHAEDGARQVSFCSDDWPPFSSEVDGSVRGISVDIAREAARRAGLEAEFRQLPWNRCLEMVRQGKVDAVLDAAPREEFITVATSHSAYTNTVWVRADDPQTRLDFADLAGHRMGLVDGYWYPDDLMAAIKAAGMRIDMSVDEGTAIRKLAFGRVDAILTDRTVTRHFVNRHDLALRPLVPDHSSDPLYISFNSGRTELRDTMDDALSEMMRDGSISAIHERHLNPNGGPEPE